MNLYYDKHERLKKVGELDEEGLSYEFHMICVWQDKASGRLFYDQDSG